MVCGEYWVGSTVVARMLGSSMLSVSPIARNHEMVLVGAPDVHTLSHEGQLQVSMQCRWKLQTHMQ